MDTFYIPEQGSAIIGNNFVHIPVETPQASNVNKSFKTCYLRYQPTKDINRKES
jgi:hypothetical protein